MLDKIFNKSIDLEINEDLIRKNKIPLLYKDPKWLEIFGNQNNELIDTIKKELQELVEEERSMEKRNREVQTEKVNLMKKILKASEVVNTDNNLDAIQLLDEYKEKILQLNDELEEITFKLETLPSEIKQKNLSLLNETINVGYEELVEKKQVLDSAVKEMDIIRNRLRELIEVKVSNEEWINKTYLYFHGVLGSEVIEKIDRQKLD